MIWRRAWACWAEFEADDAPRVGSSNLSYNEDSGLSPASQSASYATVAAGFGVAPFPKGLFPPVLELPLAKPAFLRHQGPHFAAPVRPHHGRVGAMGTHKPPGGSDLESSLVYSI